MTTLAASQVERGHYRLLIIEDEPVLRLTFRHLLETQGFAVGVAANGREGLEAFRDDPPDLVITDLIMPELDGFATIDSLRREQPELPIIAMSALVGEEEMDRAVAEGAVCCIRKPVDQRQLLELIDRTLNGAPGTAA